jgi:hypothetical protein
LRIELDGYRDLNSKPMGNESHMPRARESLFTSHGCNREQRERSRELVRQTATRY